MQFNKVAEVNRKTKDLFLKLKILRVWLECLKGCSRHICLLLCDEEGVRIEAAVRGDEDVNSLEYLLTAEKMWFTLKKFKVGFTDVVGNLTPHVYQLYIDSETEMNICDWPNSNHYLHFQSIERIFSGNACKKYPIDVLGVITWIGPIQYDESSSSSFHYDKRKRKMQFTIRNEKFAGLECVLHGGDECTDLLLRFINEKSKRLICLLRCFFVENFLGNSWLYSKEGPSKIEYNPYQFSEIEELERSYRHPPVFGYSDDHKKGYNVV